MQFEEEISDDQSWQIFLTNRIWMNWYFLCVFCIWTMKICYLLFFRINKDINIILIQRLIINPRSGQPQQLVVKWPDNCSITRTLAALHTTHTPDIMSLAPGTVTPWTMMYIMHTLGKMYLLSSFSKFDIGNIGCKKDSICRKGHLIFIHIPNDLMEV